MRRAGQASLMPANKRDHRWEKSLGEVGSAGKLTRSKPEPRNTHEKESFGSVTIAGYLCGPYLGAGCSRIIAYFVEVVNFF